MQKPLVLACARQSSDREEALRLIQTVYFKYYNVAPVGVPEILLIAKKDSRIVGTTALDLGDEDKLLSLERWYEIDYERTPLPFIRFLTVQLSRLTAVVPNVVSAISYAAVIYSLHRGKVYAIAEAKEIPANRQRALGIELHHISASRLLSKKVSEDVKAYYIREPRPQLYMMRLEQMRGAYERILAPLSDREEIILDETLFS